VTTRTTVLTGSGGRRGGPGPAARLVRRRRFAAARDGAQEAKALARLQPLLKEKMDAGGARARSARRLALVRRRRARQPALAGGEPRLDDAVTARNLATMTKLAALVEGA
jgi:hypothetical protein